MIDLIPIDALREIILRLSPILALCLIVAVAALSEINREGV